MVQVCLTAVVPCLPHPPQASVNLATETALVRVLVARGAGQAGLKALGEQLVQVRAGDSWCRK